MSTTRHVETDALASLREELIRAAGRRRSSRRRTRRAAAAVAIVVGVLAATAGAAELTGFTTGVPAVDELVGIESKTPAPGEAPAADHRPGPGDASEPLAVQMGDGTYQTVAYLARDGGVCIVSAERHRGGVRGGFGGCPPLEDVNRRVARRGGVWQGSSHGPDQRTNQFLVDGNVSAIRPLGEGDWKVLMTAPWTPQAPDARALRLAVVIDESDIGNPDDGFQPGELPPEAYNQPTLKLTYADGHSRVLRGPQAK
jgi:hypothetical protein